jgi:hypothetical protein
MTHLDGNDRFGLKAQQAALLQALVQRASNLSDFDAERLQAASRAIAHKRFRSVAKAWPAIAAWLGDDFGPRFARYAESNPLPAGGGPLADGWAFAKVLSRTDRLPDEVRLPVFSMALRYVWDRRGLRPRHGFVLRILLLRQPLRMVIGLRLPSKKTGPLVRVVRLG